MNRKNLIQIALLIVALFIFLSIWHSWGPGILLINIVVSLVALKIIGWLGVKVEVNIWSLLILLLGGIPGLLLVLFLSLTGIAFRAK